MVTGDEDGDVSILQPRTGSHCLRFEGAWESTYPGGKSLLRRTPDDPEFGTRCQPAVVTMVDGVSF